MLGPLTLALAIVAYAAFELVRSVGAPPIAYAGILPAYALVIAVHMATRVREHTRAVAPARALAAARVAVTGGVLMVGGALLYFVPQGRLAIAIGGGAASLAGLVALGSIRAEQGILTELSRPLGSLPSVLLSGLAWVAAIVTCLGEVVPDAGLPSSPLSPGLALSIAGLGSSGLMLATGLAEMSRRKLELGAADRLRSFVTIAGACGVAVVAAASLRLVHIPTLLVASAVVTALGAVIVSATHAPETLGRAATHGAMLVLLAVVPATGLALLARTVPELSVHAVFASAAIAALAGLTAPWVARWLLPRTEPWTSAFQSASRAATHTDADLAVEKALVELRSLSRRKLEAPCLFRWDPPSITTVDLAGYVRTEDASIPESVAELARVEAEGVLRAEALRAAAVRRPDVRAALAWLDDRRIAALALISEETVPIGLLGIPLGHRLAPFTLPEVRALGLLARLLGAQVSAGSKLARARAREREATVRSEAADVRERELTTELLDERHRGEAICRILAERARIGRYSPASRIAIESLERYAADGIPISIISPPGIDALPYLALFHLASEHKSAALYVVDGRRTELANLELWRSEQDSPLVQAKGGTLAILDPQLLPRLVQVYVASAYLATRDLSRAARAAVAVVVPQTLDVLVARGAVDERLADALGDRALQLPPLSDRAEDLRAIVLDRLTRYGLDRSGEPIGIEPAALALLLEHDWPANDLELDSLLLRLAVSLNDSPIVRRRDLARLGWKPSRNDHDVLPQEVRNESAPR